MFWPLFSAERPLQLFRVCDTPDSIRLTPMAIPRHSGDRSVKLYPLEALLHMLTHDSISVINKAMLDLLLTYAYLFVFKSCVSVPGIEYQIFGDAN
jgi:hypothetical protein